MCRVARVRAVRGRRGCEGNRTKEQRHGCRVVRAPCRLHTVTDAGRGNEPGLINLDGTTVPLSLQGGGQDGLTQSAIANVPFALLLDGQLLARIIAPNEPYLAVDYVELVGPAGVIPVPEPTSMSLMLLGAAGLLLKNRGRSR